MTTPRTTWLAQIAVVLVLLAAGMASGANAFLSQNSPLGENAAEAGCCQAAGSLSGEAHRGCGDLKLCDAAGLFVAPASTRYVVNNGLPPSLPSYTLNNPHGRVTGLLIFQEGGQTKYVRLVSGENNARTAGLASARNLPGANNANWHHVEFQALEIMRQRGITNATLLHNYPNGLPCPACMPIRGGVRDLSRLQGSLSSGSELNIFGLVPSPAGSTRSPWMVSPAGSVRVTGTW